MADRIFGVDLGGTTVKLGLFNTKGDMLASWEIPTRKDNKGRGILSDIAASVRNRMLQEGITDSEVVGIGLGAPGPFDDDGNIHQAVNLGWSSFNVREVMERESGLTVRCGNDANVAALGEFWKGGGAGSSEMLMVTLGTGVGGGIIHDGKVYNGFNGAAGEIGHIHVNDDETEKCGCGNKGCLEQYASATGAVRIVHRLMEKTPGRGSILKEMESFECKDIFEAAQKGDELAEEAVRIYGDYLGRGLAAVASVIDPEVIVLGGGVSRAGEVIIEKLRPSFDRYVFHGCKNVKFALATLGNDAGIYGAARLLLE